MTAMFYTTHGLMTAADYADHLADTDGGTTTVYLDDPPAWFDTTTDCPICGDPVAGHDSVEVTDAGATVIRCLPGTAATGSTPPTPNGGSPVPISDDPMHIDNVRAQRAADGAESDMFRDVAREIDGPPPPGIGALLKRALTDARPSPSEGGAEHA